MDARSDGPPPTPEQRARRDRRAIILSCIAGLVLAVPTLFGVASVVEAFRTADLGAGTAQGSPPSDDPDAPSHRDVEVPTLDLDALSGTDAEFGRLLTDVDRSERTMLAAQEGMAAAFEGIGPQDDPQDALDGVAEAAGDGQRELQELRSDLASPLDDDAAGELRDLYLSHLDAWVRYLVAIEDDPELVLRPEAESALTLAIDTTGYAFADQLRDGLPADLDDDVVEMAQAIADRGFPERTAEDRDTV